MHSADKRVDFSLWTKRKKQLLQLSKYSTLLQMKLQEKLGM